MYNISDFLHFPAEKKCTQVAPSYILFLAGKCKKSEILYIIFSVGKEGIKKITPHKCAQMNKLAPYKFIVQYGDHLTNCNCLLLGSMLCIFTISCLPPFGCCFFSKTKWPLPAALHIQLFTGKKLIGKKREYYI